MITIEGNAIIYCEGSFNTPNGKTAHGLVRFTRRYKILSVIDSRYAGKDSGQVIDGKKNGIPVVANLDEALAIAASNGSLKPTHCIVGLAPDGGRLSPKAREDVRMAINHGLHIVSGLHDFLSEDEVMRNRAIDHDVKIRDVRKPPSRKDLHFFSGKIEEVKCLKIAVLGTDSAVGKRTSAWKIVQGFEGLGKKAELIGTGQTAWMQGAKYSIILDSLINDFVSGEIEHAVHEAWKNESPDVIVLEGQGSLMNPAYPGGFEILAAGRPDIIVLQHAPKRKEYDGFPGYPIQSLKKQIEVIELLSGKKVVAVTINHEDMENSEVPEVINQIKNETGLPAFDLLLEPVEKIVDILKKHLKT